MKQEGSAALAGWQRPEGIYRKAEGRKPEEEESFLFGGESSLGVGVEH
jgi:hypothetical protein